MKPIRYRSAAQLLSEQLPTINLTNQRIRIRPFINHPKRRDSIIHFSPGDVPDLPELKKTYVAPVTKFRTFHNNLTYGNWRIEPRRMTVLDRLKKGICYV